MITVPKPEVLPSFSTDGVRFGVTFEFGVRLAPEYVVYLITAIATVITGVQYL